MASADFSYANTWHRDLPSAESPASSGIRRLSFDLSLPHLHVYTFSPKGFVKMCSLTRINMPRYVVPVRQYRSLQSCFLHCSDHSKPACSLLVRIDACTQGTCTLWIINLYSRLVYKYAILGAHIVFMPAAGEVLI
jgi:hypothetical protein